MIYVFCVFLCSDLCKFRSKKSFCSMFFWTLMIWNVHIKKLKKKKETTTHKFGDQNAMRATGNILVFYRALYWNLAIKEMKKNYQRSVFYNTHIHFFFTKYHFPRFITIVLHLWVWFVWLWPKYWRWLWLDEEEGKY